MPASLALQVVTGVLCASYWRGAWYILDYKLFPTDNLKSGIASLTLGGGLLGMAQYILSPSYNGTKAIVRMLPPPRSVTLRTRYIQTNRFIMLYGISTSCVLIWRGTWLMWDEGAHFIADTLSSRWRSEQKETNPKHCPNTTLHNAIEHQHYTNHNNESHSNSMTQQHVVTDDEILFYSGLASHVVATVGLLFMGRYASVMAPPANASMLTDLFIHGKGKSFARAAKSFTRSP